MHSKMLFAVATVISKVLSFVYDEDVKKISIGDDKSDFWSVSNKDTSDNDKVKQ